MGGVVSCHKELPVTAEDNGLEKVVRFFAIPSNADVSHTLMAMMEDIRRQDSVHHFVPNMVDKIGYPMWHQAATNEASSSLLLGSSSSVFLIPFQDEKSKRISAYLSGVQTDGKYSYSLHTREAIISRINKADTQKLKEMAGFGLVLAYFEKQANQRDTLLLPGCKLKGFSHASIDFNVPTKPLTLGEFVSVSICGEVWMPSTGQVGGGVPPGGSIHYGSWQWQCRTSTTYVQSVPMDDNGGGSNNNCMAPDGTYYWWCLPQGGGYSFLDSRTINGVRYTENDYPGMYDGYRWAWWEDELSYDERELVYDVLLENRFLPKAQHEQRKYPTQNRPFWQNVYNSYPKTIDGTNDLTALEVSVQIGGQVKTEFEKGSFKNACAIRVSMALNGAGIHVPNVPNKTWTGADGKNYFRMSSDLFKFLFDTFGEPEIIRTKADGGVGGLNFPSQLISIHNRGIYLMEADSYQVFGAEGHATLWACLNCIGGHNYFGYAGNVFI